MLLTVYNFLQIGLLIAAFPLLALVACRRKYRERILQRLGFGLHQRVVEIPLRPARQRIWLHCLSVGEVTSALPLVRGLRRQKPGAQLMVTITTTSGLRVGEELLRPWVDLVLAAPLDLWPVVHKFRRLLAPDLFILVETDFWPNWLHLLYRSGVPAMLVNGRISDRSFGRYLRFRSLFAPLFSTFALLAMQTEKDAAQMRALGVPADRILPLGNLKYAPAEDHDKQAAGGPDRGALNLPPDADIWICGSTHPGEEEILLDAFAAVRAAHPRLILLLAPRNPQRTQEIAPLAQRIGLATRRRTRPDDPPAPVLILDTLGELAACYRLARLAFIGGSLVPCGGHNPLEAVGYEVPVLFGPHMEDFEEIARNLLQCGGAMTVRTAKEIADAVRRLLDDPALHEQMRSAATNLAERQAGVIGRHLAAVARLLPGPPD